MPDKQFTRPIGYENIAFPLRKDKPWGREEWIELLEETETGRGYCLKLILLKQGERSSLQYHEAKLETQYILEGNAEISLEDENGTLQKLLFSKGNHFTVMLRSSPFGFRSNTCTSTGNLPGPGSHSETLLPPSRNGFNGMNTPGFLAARFGFCAAIFFFFSR